MLGRGYRPDAKTKYNERKRAQEQAQRRAQTLNDQARKVRDTIPGLVEREQEKVKRDARDLTKRIRDHARDEEKRFLTTPVTQYTGGAHANPAPITVWHWKVPFPEGLDVPVNGERRDDAGPILVLHPGGGIDADTDRVDIAMRSTRHGNSAQFRDWATKVGELMPEVEARYPILGKVRDDAFLAKLFSATGVNVNVKSSVEERGMYGDVYSRPVTTVRVPVLIGAEVEPDGLRLTFAHDDEVRAGDWGGATLDRLRSAFNANGVHDARNLSVHDGPRGEVILKFDDAPSSFPAAVAPVAPTTTPQTVAESISRYEATRWMLGLDARGNVVSFPLKAQPHVLVTGGTGGGKSVWARSLIESLRTGYRDTDANGGAGQDVGGGWLCWVGDGKGSDFSALEGQPGIAMVAPSSDIAQIAVMVRRVRLEVERRFAQASAAKKRGDANPFGGMQPWLLLLDEWGAVAIKMKAQYGKSESFEKDIDIILRLGRECRVHCVLLSQTIRKTGDGAVPGSWQENLGLTVSLGAPSDITLQSDAFPAEVRDRAAFIGSRLKGKRGRGLTADRESGSVVEFQSFYGWSPGTTSLSPDAPKDVQPPTAEVRAAWERWKPVCESVPWLAPRLGIKALSSDWRGGNKADLNVIANTPVVPLTDANGVVSARMRQFDPSSPEWLGAESLDAGGAVVEVGFVDEDGDGVDDRAQPTSAERPTVKAEREAKPAPAPAPKPEGQDALHVPTPEEVAAMTPEERDAWMREYARRAGHLSDDAVTETSESATETPTTDEPKPKRSTTAPTTQGDDF